MKPDSWTAEAVAWENVFERSVRNPPATTEQLEVLVADLRRPWSKDEIALLTEGAGQAYDASWELPRERPLPRKLLSLLAWSNGGTMENGDRSFAPLFGANDLRGVLLNCL